MCSPNIFYIIGKFSKNSIIQSILHKFAYVNVKTFALVNVRLYYFLNAKSLLIKKFKIITIIEIIILLIK
jgi:hypothetical protein